MSKNDPLLDVSTPRQNRCYRALDKYFQIHDRGSTIGTELRAGVVLFATMSYIIVVNPHMLRDTGLDRGAVATGTALCGMVSSIIFGMYANLPFGIAPGMGLNTLFAIDIVDQNKMTAPQALACCFVAGVILFVLSLANVCMTAVNRIPLTLKKAIVVGIGLLQTFVGLTSCGLIQRGKFSVVEFSGFHCEADKVVAIFTFFAISLLVLFDVQGSILVGLGLALAFGFLLGVVALPPSYFSFPAPLQWAHFDFSVFSSYTGAGWRIALLVAFVAFIDAGGVLVGMASQAKSLTDRHGNLQKSSRAFQALSLGVVIAAVMGTSPVVIYLESAAAVAQGGRTGLTTVVSGLLFGLTTFAVPAISAVPPCVNAPILILIGCFMMGAVMAIPWDRINNSVPAFITIIFTTFSLSVSYGIIFGLFSFFIMNFPLFIAQTTRNKWLIARLATNDEIKSNLEQRLDAERTVERHSALLSLVATPQEEAVHTDRLRVNSSVGWL